MSKTYYATRDFSDAGTEKRFAKGEKIEATDGEMGNYVAAGLATEDQPQTDEPQATKPATKSTAKDA